MGSALISRAWRVPAMSDSKSKWRVYRFPVAQRSIAQSRKAKITNCSSPFPRVRANDCSALGSESSRKWRLRGLDGYIKHQRSNLKHCPVATFISNSPAETEAIGRQF